MTTIARAAGRTEAEDLTLTLAAAGVQSWAVERFGVWEVEVSEEDGSLAREILREPIDTQTGPPPPAAGGRWPRAGIAFAAALIAAHGWAVWHGHEAVVRQAGVSGHRLAQGEVYRSITALFVHANIQHLLGNAVAMAVFGSGVAAAAGPGMSALLLVAAGALGTGLSGMVGTSYRLSIGASTAVFAAVGILAARQYVERLRVPARRLKAWIPLGAALALLSLLGTDPRSDLKAHFFGLLAGLAVGGAHARLAPVTAGRVVQILAGGLAAGLAGAAWWAAFDH